MPTTIPCLKGLVEQFTTGGMGYTGDLRLVRVLGTNGIDQQESAPPNVSYRVLTDNRVLTDLKFY